MAFGGTLVSGIQDISALLPILGTDQCEAHVGAALSTGYFYAAAAPLSIFGCLGIVKAAAGILIATISMESFGLDPDSPTLAGAAILRNAGFELQGAAAAMVGVTRDDAGGMQYLAASKLESLLAKHIDNSPVDIVFTYLRWNIGLVFWTFFWALFAMTPYIPTIVSQRGLFTTWLYPLLRIIGSVTCAVGAQFTLQIRIEQILRDTKDTLLGENQVNRLENSRQRERSAFILDKLRFALLLGIATTAAGYVGCFTVVQSSLTRDTLIWLGIETCLSLLRVYLWGLNAGWDDDTCFTLLIHDTTHSLPVNTTGLAFETDVIHQRQTFVVYTHLHEFLREMGIPPGAIPSVNAASLDIRTYYATAYAEDQRSFYILMIVVDSTTQETIVVSSSLEGKISAFSGVVYGSKTLINVTPNPFVIIRSRRQTRREREEIPNQIPVTRSQRIRSLISTTLDLYWPLQVLDQIFSATISVYPRIRRILEEEDESRGRVSAILRSILVPAADPNRVTVDRSARSIVRARVVEPLDIDRSQNSLLNGARFQAAEECLSHLVRALQDPRLRVNRIQMSWSGEIQRAWAAQADEGAPEQEPEAVREVNLTEP